MATIARILRGVTAPAIVVAVLAGPARADSAHAEDASAFFSANDPIEFVLTGPLSQIARDDAPEPQYRDATIGVTRADGTGAQIPVKIKPRGKSRRAISACQFPPLRLNFPKDAARDTPFAGLDKVKLVTHCGKLGDTNPAHATRVHLELLLYRVFARISPTSLRVREAAITYVDSDHGNKRNTHVGFLIEPESMLAARLGLQQADVESIDRGRLEPVQTSRVEMFEFLAGNTDFSMTFGPPHDKCCHNIVPLIASDGQVLSVPYDFDATGVVGAPYARPDARLGIGSIHKRLWRGYCRSATYLETSAGVFRDARADIYALFRDDPRLDAKAKNTTVEYLDAFYVTLDDPAAFKAAIISRCLAPKS